MDVDKLIREVFHRVTLWDQADKNHHHRFILDKLWDEVALELNTTRVMVRNKWKALRDKFRTTLASIPKLQTGEENTTPSHVITWKYFEKLLFLKDQFASRSPSGNFKATAEERSCFQNFKVEIEENVVEASSQSNLSSHLEETTPVSPENYCDSNSSLAARPSSSSSAGNHLQNIYNTQNKRRLNDDIDSTLLEMETKKMKYLEEEKIQNADEDEDLSFFKSLLPHIKKLSPFDKMSYRMKILQVTQDFMPRRN